MVMKKKKFETELHFDQHLNNPGMQKQKCAMCKDCGPIRCEVCLYDPGNKNLYDRYMEGLENGKD